MRNTLIVGGVAVAAIVIGVLVFLRGGDSFSNASASPATVVSFTQLARGSHSKVTMRVNYLITSSDQLNELWKMVDATSTPPKIDFKKEAVIAVFAGEQPTAGYAISVAKVEDTSARIVSITLAKPDGRCMTGQVLTTPYELVTLPATSLPLAHEDISTTTSCL
ncbi:MAG: protease complex subunit PrcB family protein [bacterium]|nr:protease complex subunit PrcB family protein [bacterium]